jgi:hypothetical protein
MLKSLLLFLAICSSAHAAQGTWKARDVAAGTDFASEHPTLKLEPKFDGDRSSCTVTDTTGGERAVTLAFCVPLDALGGEWCDDLQHARTIDAKTVYANLADRAGGTDNKASMYPIAVITKGDSATCIGMPPDDPRMVRYVYDAPRRELRAEFDFGLSPIPQKFPSRADASIVTFSVPSKWAFRQALQRYYELFPTAFVRRAKEAGIWLPFGEAGPIKDAADFGIKFHEIADSQIAGTTVKDDDRIGAGSYVYVEPQTYWQQFAGEGKGTHEERLAQLEKEAKDGVGIAQGTMVSGIILQNGKRDLYMDPVAYTKQQPWGNDPNPLIPPNAQGWPSKGKYENDRLEKVLGWSDNKPTGVDGVYVDSMEGWGEILNFNHDHWRIAQFPLTFDPAMKKVCLLNFWGTVQWVKQMSEKSHQHDTVLFGNDAFYRRWQLAAFVDVPGREYTWLTDGKFTPVEDERYLFFRAMSGKKPYLMLMNNKFEDASIMEPYFQRNLFYAVFPSMFIGHAAMNEVSYFDNPAWYNRDRPLFKKYLPMIRKLDAAGWEPVPHATASPQTTRIERYGSAAGKTLAFTVHNPAASQQTVTLKLDREDLKLPTTFAAMEWITAKPAHVDGDTVKLAVPANGYAVVEITAGSASTNLPLSR